MDDARVPTTEQLMAEMGWVRKLARALVQDSASADDVAQDAWLVAAEQQPDAARPLRPWLARVVTMLVHTRRRGDARRDDRHAAAGDDRTVPTPAELLERVELQRAVADELLALSEPYRSTVLLHFIEGFSSAEIARRLGIPDGTVRRRLKVALDQLRTALSKRTDQPARGWLAALVPLAAIPDPRMASTSLGGLAVKKGIAIVASLLLLLALVGGIVLHRRGKARTSDAAEATTPAHRAGSSSAGAATASTTIPPWMLQPGVPARHIAGRVLFHGSPVAGATVQLGLNVTGEMMREFVMPDAGPRVLQPIAEVKSGTDGAFDFGAQPPAGYTVSAAAGTYAPIAVPVLSMDPHAKTDQLVLALEECRTRMTGTIADASGGGIANARVSVAGLAGTDSDAAGNYSVCLTARDGFGTPTANVRVVADGYGTIRQDVIVVGDLRVDFKLVPEAVIVGRVTTPDGKPVAAARVIANAAPGPTRTASGWTTANADGSFRIVGLAPAAFDLFANAAGAATTAPVPVVARPAATSPEIHVIVAPLAEVRGQVFMNGEPVAGATVAAVHDGKPAGGGTSQADGSFVLSGVPYGSVRLFVTPERLDPPKALTIDRAVVDAGRLDVTKSATIRGHVRRHGEAVAGAGVIYMGTPQATIVGPLPTATSDASGAFVLEGVPAGPGRIVAWHNPTKAWSEWADFDMRPMEDKTLDLDLTCSGDVKGTVVDEHGTAVAGIYVRFDIVTGGDFCEAMTDTKGQFDCAMLYGGTYQPTVAPLPGGRQGFAPAVGARLETVQVPKDGVVTGVTLAIKHERVAIRGTVVDDTGAPMADVQIDAAGRGDASMDVPSTMSDADGHFQIGDLARGTYVLQARAADGSTTDQPDVPAGGDPVTIKLARAGGIAGTLAGFSRTPDVFVLPHVPGAMLKRALVDGNRVSAIGLTPGRYTVEAQAGADVDSQIVDVRPGETAEVTLRNRGSGMVEGTITDFETHAGIAGMRCDAKLLTEGQASMVPPDPAQQAYTDAAGHYRVSAPIGHVRIFCFAMSGPPRSAAGGNADVAASGTAKVDGLSVRANPSQAPADAGFMIAPMAIPPLVAGVLPTGPAAAAGLRAGDQLVSIDGQSVQGLLPDGALFLIANHKPGTTVTMGILRNGAGQTIKIPIGVGPR